MARKPKTWAEIAERIKRRLRKAGVNCVEVSGGIEEDGWDSAILCIAVENRKQQLRMPAWFDRLVPERQIKRAIRFFTRHYPEYCRRTR